MMMLGVIGNFKYETIKEYGLRGASYWALNLQTPPNWSVLVSNFKVAKL